MKLLFISEKMPDYVENMLKDFGFVIRGLKSEPSLPLPVSSHADMIIFSDGKKMITTKNYYEKNPDIFNDVDVMRVDRNFGDKYPNDVIFNSFVYRGRLFGRWESLCEEVKNLYTERVNLSQGYAKCSTLLYSDNAVTSDRIIAQKLKESGAEVTLISPGGILLQGYNYGFIGGASMVYENKVIFFGDITAHIDYQKIKDHIKKAGFELCYSKDGPLCDLGGGIVVDNC